MRSLNSPQSIIPTRHNTYNKLCFQLHDEQRPFYCEKTKKMNILNTRILCKNGHIIHKLSVCAA
jgi:hypothetical protein